MGCGWSNYCGCIDNDVFMMKKDLMIFLLAVLSYGLNRLNIDSYNNVLLSCFMTSYFNDIVGSIAFVAYCNILLFTQERRIQRLFSIILIMCLCGIIWEYVTPIFREDAVTDILDIVAYIIGGCVYWGIDFIGKTNTNEKNITG